MPSAGDADDFGSVSLEAQIDRLCDEYEAAWRAGRRPQIEAVLERLPESSRGELLRELVRIDVELRREGGESPTVEEYVRRFPGHQSPVEAGFAPARKPPESRSLAVDETQSRGHALHIRCPHCHHPIELVDDRPLAEMTCPSCGSKFTLATGETLDGPGGTTGVVRHPTTLGHFELLEQLGTGGFGTVWKARDTKLDRIVAVKIPRKGSLGPDEVEKFLREARTAAQLQHPNIVSVHEVGLEGDVIYIVSDFIDGRTLDRWLAEQQPTIREAAELCRKLAETLHYAHEHGVIHRDLKPANVILDAQGEPHVMDFGLAKREAGEITMTMEGQVLGTPAYMSPEQARGEAHAADRRTDVYSLGVMLFELLTGERPFRGNVRMLLKQVIEDEPASLCKLDSRIPRDLETICLKCLEKDQGRRYQSASDLGADLACWLKGEPIAARPAGLLERAMKWSKRQPAAAVLISMVPVLCVRAPEVAFFLGAVILGMTLHFRRQPRALLVTAVLTLVATAGLGRILSWGAEDLGAISALMMLFACLGTITFQSVWNAPGLPVTWRRRALVAVFGACVLCASVHFMVRHAGLAQMSTPMSMKLGFLMGQCGSVATILIGVILAAALGVLFQCLLGALRKLAGGDSDMIFFAAAAGTIVSGLIADYLFTMAVVSRFAGGPADSPSWLFFANFMVRLSVQFFPAAVVFMGLARGLFLLMGIAVGGAIGARISAGYPIVFRPKLLQRFAYAGATLGLIYVPLSVVLSPQAHGVGQLVLGRTPVLIMLPIMLVVAVVGAVCGTIAGGLVEVVASLIWKRR